MASPNPRVKPATTARGTLFSSRGIQPQAVMASSTEPRIMPVAATSPGLSPWAMITAATTFIGCTGRGRR